MKDFNRETLVAVVTICYILTIMLISAGVIIAMSIKDYKSAAVCLAMIVAYSFYIIFLIRKENKK